MLTAISTSLIDHNLLPGAGLVAHNKLLTYQDKRYRYDAFGRMIEKRSAKRGLQRFAYDAESRLIEVRNDNGSVVKMTYDPLGRRIEKTEHDSHGYPLGETRFTWDGLRLLEISAHPKSIERDLSALFEWIRSCTRISIDDEDGEQSGW